MVLMCIFVHSVLSSIYITYLFIRFVMCIYLLLMLHVTMLHLVWEDSISNLGHWSVRSFGWRMCSWNVVLLMLLRIAALSTIQFAAGTREVI
jgi:hypothetical protein